MGAKSVDLSIIIISYNTKEITKNCLDSVFASLAEAPFTFEVIVLDNASKDGSAQMLEKDKRIRAVISKDNTGFARGNNIAVKQAKGSHLLLLNSDTIVLDNAIGKLWDFYAKNPQAHFLGAKLLNRDMTPQASAAPFYTPPVVFAALFLKGDYWGLTRSSPDKTRRVDWVSGACILAKKEYYDSIGGFDEGIFMYMDEVDLLYRAREKGHLTYFYPEARIIHLGSASSKGKTYPILQVYRGFLYFYRKHYSGLELTTLRIMLQLKALVSIIIGYATNNSYLKNTYEEALRVARQ